MCVVYIPTLSSREYYGFCPPNPIFRSIPALLFFGIDIGDRLYFCVFPCTESDIIYCITRL